MMKSVVRPVLMWGMILFLGSSCATVPTGPLSAGELRFLRVEVPGGQSLGLSYPFQVRITYESSGGPEIKRVCLYYSNDGPYCYAKLDAGDGLISLWLRADKRGSYMLECYAEYSWDGKMQRTNSVSTPINIVPNPRM